MKKLMKMVMVTALVLITANFALAGWKDYIPFTSKEIPASTIEKVSMIVEKHGIDTAFVKGIRDLGVEITELKYAGVNTSSVMKDAMKKDITATENRLSDDALMGIVMNAAVEELGDLTDTQLTALIKGEAGAEEMSRVLKLQNRLMKYKLRPLEDLL